MAMQAVAEAVNYRLTAQWTATPVIEYDSGFDPPQGEDAFLVVQYPVSNGVRLVLGRKFAEEGAFLLVLNVKKGVGLSQGLEWSDSLMALFRYVKFDGVETFMPNGPVIDDGNDDDEGGWIEYSIAVPYRFQFED